MRSLIARITKLFDASERKGLEMVYPNRMEALKEFALYMKEEREEVLIIGSSLLGLFLYVPGFKDIVQENPKKFKFLLTHPDDSSKREGPEGRDPGVIRREIIEGIHKLIKWDVPLDNIRLYRVSPTVFTIITSTHMLLNPYPYCTEAYRCWCLQVSSKGSIYKQYYGNTLKMRGTANGLRNVLISLKELRRKKSVEENVINTMDCKKTSKGLFRGKSNVFKKRRITADKRLRYASPKLPTATSLIRKTLTEMTLEGI